MAQFKAPMYKTSKLPKMLGRHEKKETKVPPPKAPVNIIMIIPPPRIRGAKPVSTGKERFDERFEGMNFTLPKPTSMQVRRK